MNKTIIYSHITFLSWSEVSIVFNVSFSYPNTNLPIRCVVINGVTTSTAVINTNSKWIKESFIRVLLTIGALVWHGWLFKNTHFKGSLELKTNESPMTNGYCVNA